MITNITIVIFGFIFLIIGADVLVKGASNIAKKLKIPEILIGLTIVAIGTSLPELIVTITSSINGSTELVAGNVIGSNLTNLLLILGISAILKPIKIEKTTIKIYLPLLLIISIITIAMGFGLFGGEKFIINKVEGCILLIMAIFYFLIPIIKEKENIRGIDKKINNEDKNNIENEKTYIVIKSLGLILVGIILLKYGGDFVVESSSKIATLLGLSQTLIGLTVVAIGTSLPELITSIVAIIKHDDDIAEGNIIGSCIVNILLILGTGAIIENTPYGETLIGNSLLLIGVIILIWLFSISNQKREIERINGILLLLIYILYTVKLFI